MTGGDPREAEVAQETLPHNTRSPGQLSLVGLSRAVSKHSENLEASR